MFARHKTAALHALSLYAIALLEGTAETKGTKQA